MMQAIDLHGYPKAAFIFSKFSSAFSLDFSREKRTALGNLIFIRNDVFLKPNHRYSGMTFAMPIL